MADHQPAAMVALGLVMVTMFFSFLVQTIVATAMPAVLGDLKGFALCALVFAAYSKATSVTAPIYGRLSDIHGWKPSYLSGPVIFMIGSAISGRAGTMVESTIARAIQGIDSISELVGRSGRIHCTAVS